MEGQVATAAPPPPPVKAGPGSAAITDRMKALLNAPASNDAPADAPGGVAPQVRSKATSDEGSDAVAQKVAPENEQVPDPAQAAAEDQADDSVDVQSDDAQSEDWQPSSLSELAQALGWDEGKLLDLPAKVKIDGKEGTAPLRDLFKSYQLDGHINQRLEAVNNDRKTLEGERQKFQSERADKLLRMDAGLQTLERSLYGEFASVDWKKLAAEDPNTYNAKVVAFQARNAELQDIAQSIQTERAQYQAQLEGAQKAYLEEQRQLLLAKIPEWADESVRGKEKAGIVSYLGELGFSKEEAEGIVDHRQALVVRDAWKWRELQKSRPSVLKKVNAAPKLLKPGTQQSRAAQVAVAQSKDRDRLRQSGRVSDAARAIASRLKASM